MAIIKLKNTIQNYAWGSTTLIPELLGLANPDNTPMAELWMGAHPRAPSKLLVGSEEMDLLTAISDNPTKMLGRRLSDKYDGKLPFLFKVLAAGSPLSIQAHPNLNQAVLGYERENALGIPPDATFRNYKDANHKPEILCALTEFWAMCGFRKAPEICEDLNTIDLGNQRELFAIFLSTCDEPSFPSLFQSLLELPSDQKTELINRIVAQAGTRDAPRYAWMVKLNGLYPGDVGVLCPLLLNLLYLQPGQALYLDAGELHAYLSGMGIELMANSDNVLRGGLTPKHVDVPELLKTLTFRMRPQQILQGYNISDSEIAYKTPAKEFYLSRIGIQDQFQSRSSDSCEIYFISEGDCTVSADSHEELLYFEKGDSFFVTPDSTHLRIGGRGVIYRASVPTGT